MLAGVVGDETETGEEAGADAAEELGLTAGAVVEAALGDSPVLLSVPVPEPALAGLPAFAALLSSTLVVFDLRRLFFFDLLFAVCAGDSFQIESSEASLVLAAPPVVLDPAPVALVWPDESAAPDEFALPFELLSPPVFVLSTAPMSPPPMAAELLPVWLPPTSAPAFRSGWLLALLSIAQALTP